MIGASEISLAPNGERMGSHWLHSVDCSTDATGGRRAACNAVSEVLSQQMVSRVAERAGSYGISKRLNLPEVTDEDGLEKNVSELGVWITYLEKKYDLIG